MLTHRAIGLFKMEYNMNTYAVNMFIRPFGDITVEAEINRLDTPPESPIEWEVIVFSIKHKGKNIYPTMEWWGSNREFIERSLHMERVNQSIANNTDSSDIPF